MAGSRRWSGPRALSWSTSRWRSPDVLRGWLRGRHLAVGPRGDGGATPRGKVMTLTVVAILAVLLVALGWLIVLWLAGPPEDLGRVSGAWRRHQKLKDLNLREGYKS